MEPGAIIALARLLWPLLTVEAASDAFLLAWYPWALAQAGTRYGIYQSHAIAHLLAHAVYQVNPGGLIQNVGVVTSISTGELSVSYSQVQQQAAASDSDLASTPPGRAVLLLRNSRAGIMVPRVF